MNSKTQPRSRGRRFIACLVASAALCLAGLAPTASAHVPSSTDSRWCGHADFNVYTYHVYFPFSHLDQFRYRSHSTVAGTHYHRWQRYSNWHGVDGEWIVQYC